MARIMGAPRVLGLFASVLFLGQIPLSANPITTETFTFTGPCVDCTGVGVGTLVLANYTLGADLTTDNFVSFSYTSNLTTFTLTGVGPDFGEIDSIFGILPETLPSAADVTFTSSQLLVFQSASSGTWCAGISGCNLDFGIEGATWQAGVPEPATGALMFAGFGGLTLLWLARKIRRVGASHS